MVTPDAWLLAFCRVAPAVALHPLFGGRTAPRVVAVGTSAALAAAVASARPDAAVFTLAAAARQALAGAAVGLVGQAVFGTIEAAGRFVDDARGANVARLYAPQLESTASPLGRLELLAALAITWGLGLHAPLVRALAGGIEPAPGLPPLDALLEMATRLARAGLALAGPAVAACVVVDVLMGLVNRASPHANVFLLGQPAKLAAAVLVTALGTPARVGTWVELVRADAAWAARLLGGT
jgi:flagellar biosynthetic protein FliR